MPGLARVASTGVWKPAGRRVKKALNIPAFLCDRHDDRRGSLPPEIAVAESRRLVADILMGSAGP